MDKVDKRKPTVGRWCPRNQGGSRSLGRVMLISLIEGRDAAIELRDVVGNSLKSFLQRGTKMWDEI